MRQKDKDKIAFITKQGTFCFKVMPFHLKNAGGTFQRLMDNIFKEQIGRNLEVYVDDILVRLVKVEFHLQDLKEIFGNFLKVGLQIKASKCTSRVTKRKFLG